MKFKLNPWFNIKASEPAGFGIDVLCDGAWCHVLNDEGNGPLLIADKAEATCRGQEIVRKAEEHVRAKTASVEPLPEGACHDEAAGRLSKHLDQLTLWKRGGWWSVGVTKGVTPPRIIVYVDATAPVAGIPTLWEGYPVEVCETPQAVPSL